MAVSKIAAVFNPSFVFVGLPMLYVFTPHNIYSYFSYQFYSSQFYSSNQTMFI